MKVTVIPIVFGALETILNRIIEKDLLDSGRTKSRKTKALLKTEESIISALNYQFEKILRVKIINIYSLFCGYFLLNKSFFYYSRYY